MLHLFLSYAQTHYKYIKFPQRVIFRQLSYMFSLRSPGFSLYHTASYGIVAYHTVSLWLIIWPLHTNP